MNALPLIRVTSNWVKEVYVRDGISGDNIVVLPVGCDTDRYSPHSRDDLKVQAIREDLGISEDQIMIPTAGGNGTSKGAQEVMQALALIDAEVPDWRYVCKVWPQPRTVQQNLIDLKLAADLGIDKKVIYSTNNVSHRGDIAEEHSTTRQTKLMHGRRLSLQTRLAFASDRGLQTQ